MCEVGIEDRAGWWEEDGWVRDREERMRNEGGGGKGTF